METVRILEMLMSEYKGCFPYNRWKQFRDR